MRPRTACSACRQRQRRCVVRDESRTLACEFCVRNKHECSLVPTLTNSPTERDTVASSPYSYLCHSGHARPEPINDEAGTPASQAVTSDLPPLDACVEIVSAYFIYIHDPSHYVFHRPSFMTDVTRGVVPRSLILCVIALAARFSTHPFFAGATPRSRGNMYARQAENLLDLHSITVVTLQTALLLGAFYGTEGDSLHENLYYSLACRIGCLLNLPDCLADTPLNRELGIRLWWTLDMIDVWSSNNMRLPRLLVPREDVPEPSSEESFLRMRRTHSFDQISSELQSEGSTSLLIQKIKLNSLLSEIAQLNKVSADETLTSHDMRVATDALAQRINKWQQGLPESLINTPENLIAQAASGSGGAFVALHVGFYHFSQLLYYPFLHQSVQAQSSLDEIHRFAGCCRDSSTALCELLYAAQALPGAEVYYSMIGHALVISSTVQLYILLFSDDGVDCHAARRRLEKNFMILCNLQNLWRTVDHSFGRFIEFHTACMRSKETLEDPSRTFKLDKWMLRFLMEFSKPVEKRGENDSNTPNDPGQLCEWNAIYEGVEYDFRHWTVVELGIDLDNDQDWNPTLGLESWENRMEV